MDSGATSTRTPLGGSLQFAPLGLRHMKLRSPHTPWFGMLGKARELARCAARPGAASARTGSGGSRETAKQERRGTGHALPEQQCALLRLRAEGGG